MLLAKEYKIEKKLANLIRHNSPLKKSLSKELNSSKVGIKLFDLLSKSKSAMLINLVSELFLSPNPFFGLKVIGSSVKSRVFKKYGITSEGKS